MGVFGAIVAQSKPIEMMPVRVRQYFVSSRKLAGIGTFLLGCLLSNPWAIAQTQAPQAQSPQTVANVAIVPSTRTVSLDLKQLGSWSALKLKGMDASKVLAFTVRTDEVVVAAKFSLNYDYSPSLIEELSHLQIHLNDRVVAIDGLPKGKNLGVKREVNLEVGAIRDYNELRFNFVGFASGKCGAGMNASLWLTISELSRLELTLAPKPLAPDLKHLPAPFYDKRDNQPVNLPFVFAANPSLGTIKAAGIVASWFGIQAGNRGAQFPSLLNEIPPSNAIVFLNGKEEVTGFKGVPGAVVSVQVNPNNPNARLLLINGSNDAELMRAAKAIALVHTSLSGKDAAIVSDAEMAPRQPYDAPAWVRTDKPVKFGEIAKPEDLRVKGFMPETIRVNYRLPPDLFTWRTAGVPMQLKYRATRLPGHKNSSLRVALNNTFIDAMALNEPLQSGALNAKKQSGNNSVWETSLFLPPYAMSMRDQLQLSYSFDILKDGECPELAPDNLVAAIDAESTLDFSVFPKYAALPNLAYFSQLGFPFTRFADLSETAVVISERPSAPEITLYLSVLGRMGEATGLPSLQHSLVTASELSKTPDKDLIVIGTAQNQRLFADWANAMPMYVDNGIRRLREPDVSWRPSYRWEQQDTNIGNKPKGSISLSGSGSLATIMAFESPLKPTRSVVFLYADKPVDFKRITNVLTDPDLISSVQGDFVIANDKSAAHTTISPTYYLGSLPWQNKLKWFLADNPILVAFLALVLALLSAIIVYRPLKFLGAKVFKKAG
jgi:cellulose synthase operon protein B